MRLFLKMQHGRGLERGLIDQDAIVPPIIVGGGDVAAVTGLAIFGGHFEWLT